NDITCYRLYDRDIPEVPLAVELYRLLPEEIFTKFQIERLLAKEAAAISSNGPEAAAYIADALKNSWLHIYLYERPYEKDEEEEEIWLDAMAQAASEAAGIERDHVIIKTRKKMQMREGQRHRNQYEKRGGSDSRQGSPASAESSARRREPCTVQGTMQEQGQLFQVNLTDYIDTGLFLDHRLLRREIREQSNGKSVLNLFCYTGSFSVYAAEGKARRITSVDMSRTYLSWAKKNLELNEFNPQNEYKYSFICQDAVKYLKARRAEKEAKDGVNRFDLIILDPPTFSNSKDTDTILDINRNWPELVADALSLLNEGGSLYFSTNSRRLKFEEDRLPKAADGASRYRAEDISQRTISEDYRNQKIHRVWKITEA
ncbi:MAG: class I SAM-dependent methyltransferase, partial [Treponema sp.]|nr:class I SAM-dependent methyltransferase [Treponema sp.]